MSDQHSGMREINYLSLDERRIFRARVSWQDGIITEVRELGGEAPGLGYMLPGFIDAHVHIESAMLPPAEFGRIALCHGTLAVVADPHEIANVLGMDGVRFMLDNARQSPFHAYFGAPSCVPATPFETAGGSLGCDDIEQLFREPEVCCLSEMMNYPGVLSQAPDVMAKIELATRLGYPVDGHAPGLKGAEAAAYVQAGISTDHECFSLQEARDKIAAGMHVLIREGSAARNFEALHPLLDESPAQVMFCSDDKHPDDLLQGHINDMVRRAVAAGHDLFDVLRCACINPIDHYRLPLGRLRPGDPMDGIEVPDLTGFKPERVWLAGDLVAEQGEPRLPRVTVEPVNRFHARPVSVDDLVLQADAGPVRVIGVEDGSLVTQERWLQPRREAGRVVTDPDQDLLLLCVVNRYRPEPPAVALVQGFGLREGAIASSVAHDSHNIICVGTDPALVCQAVNGLIDHRGGVVVATDGALDILPLPIAGIMSDGDGFQVGDDYARLDRRARALGSPLSAPFMTLSFMALLVIPELKLSDQGLFDGRSFSFVGLQGGT